MTTTRLKKRIEATLLGGDKIEDNYATLIFFHLPMLSAIGLVVVEIVANVFIGKL